MDNFLTTVFYIVKIVAITQIILVILCLFVIYILKLIFSLMASRRAKLATKTRELLYTHFNDQTAFSSQTIIRLRKRLQPVLAVIRQIETEYTRSDYLPAFIKYISDEILKPTGRIYAFKHDWFKKFMATQSFLYGFDKEDASIIIKLIGDSSLLVSINASLVGLKYPTPDIVNSMLDIFYETRRIQQSVFAKLLSKESTVINSMILDRLKEEPDMYMRIFCYRVLTELPPQTRVSYRAKYDLQLDSVDLKIAALNYIAHANNPLKVQLIFKYCDDPHWQIRAIVAKNLGYLDGETSLQILENLLRDNEWWVRMNAGNSLAQKGVKGLMILNSQSPKTDKFAYETAQAVLTRIKNACY
jgi:hypothetical protein